MISLEARLVGTFPVFQALPPEARATVLREGMELRAPAGTAMFDPGSTCQAFPMLLEGSIRVSRVGDNGRELLLYRVTPGESCVLTSSCLLGNSVYPARGVAERDLFGLALSQPAFNRLVEQYPAFRNYIFSLFTDRLADMMELVEMVAFRRLDQRLAGLLLGKGEVVLATHQHLADELGCTREMVSRLLKNFEDQGLVSLGRQQVRLLDPAGLRRTAG